ncbi:hypothetical protein PBY51_014055 [Eleginops maclovinus]|nr:hypothetical protein PBY51_014055 [Eleginops maclovinus]
MRTSKDAMISKKDTLQQRLKDLSKQQSDLKILEVLHRETSNRVDVLQRGNVFLKESINDVNEQVRMRHHFKGELEKLEASEESLKAEKSSLSKTLAEVKEKYLGEAHWKQKYMIQKELRDTMQAETEKIVENIHFFEDQLRAQDEFKVQYKWMKALKKLASNRNNTLRKQLNNLLKNCGSEHTLQAKISTVQEETATIQSQGQEQQDQIKTLTDKLSLYDSLRVDNSAMTQEGEDHLKELHELTKAVERRVREARR